MGHDDYPVTGLPRPRSLTVRMDVTNRCNLDCIHCTLAKNRELRGESEGDMPVAVFEKIAAEVFPFAHTVALSCEAEPTMHGRFVEILDVVARHPGPRYFMTTNASMLTARKVEAIFDSGVAGVNFSLDGSTAETFERIRRPARFAKVIEGIEALVAAKRSRGLGRGDAPGLHVLTVLMRSTLDELPDLVERCRAWDVARLTFQHLYEVGQTGLVDESLVFDMERSDRVVAHCAALCAAYGIETTFPPPFLGPPLPSDPASPDGPSCKAPWSMLRIRWDGTLQPCDHFRRASMGSLAESPFVEIWHSDRYESLRRQHAARDPRHTICRSCTVVTTDNLERRTQTSPLVLTSTDAAELYVAHARKALVEDGDPWARIRQTLLLVAGDPAVDRSRLAEAVAARSWRALAEASLGCTEPQVRAFLAGMLESAGEDLGAELLRRHAAAPGSARGWGQEERHLRLAVEAAREGRTVWADAHVDAALQLGTSMANAPRGAHASLDGVLAHCDHASTLSALANVKLLRGDRDGARRLFARYLAVDPETPDADVVRLVLRRLEAECLLEDAAGRFRRGDLAGGDAAVREAVAADLGQGFDGDPLDALPRVTQPTTCLGLAAALAERGDRAGAARCYRAYVALVPDAPDRAAAEAQAAALEAANAVGDAPAPATTPLRRVAKWLGLLHEPEPVAVTVADQARGQR